MRRRRFLAALAGAATWPASALSQVMPLPVIGFLSTRSHDDSKRVVAAFVEGLAGTGFTEGRNAVIEYRWANGQYDRVSGLAAELIQRPVAVLAAVGGHQSGLAAKALTTSIPIIFGLGTDPVKMGLVASMNRPGVNMSGATFVTSLLGSKRLGLLRELVPGVKLIGLVVNPKTEQGQTQIRDVQEAAGRVGQQLVILNAGSDDEIDQSYASLERLGVGALLVAGDPFLDVNRERLISLAAQHRLPAIYQFREYALAGGLMSYGASITDMYRQVGTYVGRVLHGDRPADLPVVQPAKYELVINLKTASALGLAVPNSMHLLADEVIE